MLKQQRKDAIKFPLGMVLFYKGRSKWKLWSKMAMCGSQTRLYFQWCSSKEYILWEIIMSGQRPWSNESLTLWRVSEDFSNSFLCKHSQICSNGTPNTVERTRPQAYSHGFCHKPTVSEFHKKASQNFHPWRFEGRYCHLLAATPSQEGLTCSLRSGFRLGWSGDGCWRQQI